MEARRQRRTEALERVMLAFRDAREPYDVLAIVARGLAFEFGRPCTAYELRAGAFRPVVASELTSVREPIAASSLDLEQLRLRPVVRDGSRDIVPVSSDGLVRALVILEHAEDALDDEDARFLEAVSAHAALALTTASSFEQLRRYAAEGAALTEAARTILAFNQLEPLAGALCDLAVRLVHAEAALVYGRRDGDRLVLTGSQDGERRVAFPETLPAERIAAVAQLKEVVGANAPLIAMPIASAGSNDPERGGLLVVTRRREPFGRADVRVAEALVTLAALAIRNVELYEQSTRANRALAESSAFKDDLMAMFAHDFKGPLTVISGFAELLLETENGEVRSSAETIIEQTRRLARLAEDALALAATQSAGFSLRRMREDLAAFVRESVQALAGSDRVAIEGAEPLLVAFDRVRLRHVIDNLVGNALKYSSEPVRVRVARERDVALVEVTDRGIGIPERELERVFARFGRGSNAPRGVAGSGVGLYIAKKIVEVHGGRLDVTSRQDEGSTFTLSLPLD